MEEKKEAGYIIQNGKAVCPGVVCKCNDPIPQFCAMHGLWPIEQQRLEQRERDEFDERVDEGYDGLLA